MSEGDFKVGDYHISLSTDCYYHIQIGLLNVSLCCKNAMNRWQRFRLWKKSGWRCSLVVGSGNLKVIGNRV
jgi:hypothetical protein